MHGALTSALSMITVEQGPMLPTQLELNQ